MAPTQGIAGARTQAPHPARWWRREEDGRILCTLCPRYCRMGEGQAGFCFIRQNTGGELVIRIADQGKGLDASNIPDPLAPENLLKQSGRGIFLMRAFMDEVRFRTLDPGSEVTLIKKVAAGAPADTKEDSK